MDVVLESCAVGIRRFELAYPVNWRNADGRMFEGVGEREKEERRTLDFGFMLRCLCRKRIFRFCIPKGEQRFELLFEGIPLFFHLRRPNQYE